MIKINANTKLKKRIFFAANELGFGGLRLQATDDICGWVENWATKKGATVFIYSHKNNLLKFAFTTDNPIMFFLKIFWNEIKFKSKLTIEGHAERAINRAFGLFSK
jgi:hypothetical protein